jgi:uncharacterized protein YeaO (DUF488 family)
MIRLKRTYEPPSPEDGGRFLVERLWPRGMKREALEADAWLKEVAPSTELRKWFRHRTERWDDFRRRYREELAHNPSAWQPILEAGERGTVTLLYSTHDLFHNGARVLRDFLLEQEARRVSGPKVRQRATGSRAFASAGGRTGKTLPGAGRSS